MENDVKKRKSWDCRGQNKGATTLFRCVSWPRSQDHKPLLIEKIYGLCVECTPDQ